MTSFFPDLNVWLALSVAGHTHSADTWVWANLLPRVIDCVTSRNKADLNAPIEEGHISRALVHLANAPYRLGRTINFNPDMQQVIGDEEAERLLRDGDRGYRAPFLVPEV